MIAIPECNPSDAEIKNFLITSLTMGDECAKDALEQVIDDLWIIAGFSTGCGEKINQYLNARLKAIQLLMACAARQFDTKDSLFESAQQGDGDGRSDGWSHAQATNQGYRITESASCASYEDFARAKMRSGSQRDSKACSSDKSFSIYTDTGEGKNKTIADSTRQSENSVGNESGSKSVGATTGRSGGSGCTWTFSVEDGAGRGESDQGTATPLSAGATAASTSYSATSWAHHMEDQQSSRQTETRNGDSYRRYGRAAKTDNKAQSETCSYFDANVYSHSDGQSQSRSADDSSAFRQENAHAEGAGRSFSKTDARGEVSAQATGKSHNDGSRRRDSTRYNRTTADTISNSQLFANLKIMHAITLQNLEYADQIGNASRGPLWSKGVCQIMRDGHADIRLWLLCTQGYRQSVHPYPVRDCCDDISGRVSGGQLTGGRCYGMVA